MKTVLMSIHPKWCEKIFNGEKTIEVRKTAPKVETPFTVYVYQTKHKGKSIVSEVLNSVYGGGKAIGSFVCDKVRFLLRGKGDEGCYLSMINGLNEVMRAAIGTIAEEKK